VRKEPVIDDAFRGLHAFDVPGEHAAGETAIPLVDEELLAEILERPPMP
jgi:hypothetical protein